MSDDEQYSDGIDDTEEFITPQEVSYIKLSMNFL